MKREEKSPIVTIAGDLVRLGPLRRELIPVYARWRNDPRVMLSLTGQVRPETIDEVTAWYEASTRAGDGAVRFQVYAPEHMPIGCVQLSGIDLHNRTAGFGLWICEPDQWGKGYGTEATRLMLRYGFEVIGLHSISLAVDAENQRAIRAYARAGFQPIGRQREVAHRSGRRVDELLMDCLAREFLGPDRQGGEMIDAPSKPDQTTVAPPPESGPLGACWMRCCGVWEEDENAVDWGSGRVGQVGHTHWSERICRR